MLCSITKKLERICLFAFLIGGFLLVYPSLLFSEEQVDVGVKASIAWVEPFVITHPATAIEMDKANLRGELVSLSSEDEVEVFFEYREKGSPFWHETSRRIVVTPSFFSVTFTGLAESSTYEFRAAVSWIEGRNSGDVLDFTTGQELPSLTPSQERSFSPIVCIGGGITLPLILLLLLVRKRLQAAIGAWISPDKYRVG